MRFTTFAVGLLALLTPLASAWSKEDREIFRVRDEILAQEGADVTFYDILGIARNAGQDDITKAYRKMTRSLHPDKVRQQLVAERAKRKAANKDKDSNTKPGVRVTKPPTESEIRAAQKVASEKQTRLSLIVNILRGPERDRYDHFLANGFPVWKGTNYYYNRYRPGFGTVLVGIFIVGGGGFHYLAMYMSWKRQREFVERYIRFARQTAWGENLGIPSAASRAAAAVAEPEESDNDSEAPRAPRNRRERRMQEKETRREAGKKAPKKQRPTTVSKADQAQQVGPQGTRKRVVAENGKILLVDSLGDVYLEEEDEDGNVEAFLLDPNELPKPTIRDTAVVRVPAWIYTLTVGRVFSALPARKPDEVEQVVEALEDDDDDSEPAQPTPDSESVPDDFEMLDKSVDELGKAKSTGAQTQGGGKKRKGKKK